MRDAAGAEQELARSLARLQTDYLDLYQFHAVTEMAEVEQIFAPGGAMETFLKARQEGKVRHLGFSAHSAEAAVAMLRRFPFDSVLVPLNFCSYMKGDFGPQVVQAAGETGAGVLALKAMARTGWPEGTDRQTTRYPKCWYEPLEDERTAALAFRFTLSLPIAASIPPAHVGLWEIALREAQDPRPLSEEEELVLQEEAARTEPLFRATVA